MRRTSWRKQIRTQFRTLRASANLCQEEAAERARITFYRYRRIENGYAARDKEEEVRLARVFKISVTAFRETVPQPEVIGER